MTDAQYEQLIEQIQRLKPTDRFFHWVASCPYPWEKDNLPLDQAFWSREVVQDVMGLK